MEENQKRIGIIALSIFVIIILFPPHTKEREHVYWNAKYTNMEKRINYSEDNWIFRPIWKEETVQETHSSEGGGKIKGTDIEKMAGGYIITDEFKLMKTEWFALMGFMAIITLGTLIYFKK